MSGRHAGLIGQSSDSYSDAIAIPFHWLQLVLMEFSSGTIDYEWAATCTLVFMFVDLLHGNSQSMLKHRSGNRQLQLLQPLQL